MMVRRWLNRVSSTKPRDESRFEFRVLQYVHLRKIEPRPLTRVTIDLTRPSDNTRVVTTPDQIYYFHVTRREPILKAQLAVYIDLEQIHFKTLKSERDELRRQRLREAGWRVQAYTYRRNTKKRMREIGNEIIALVKKIDQQVHMEAARELGLLPEVPWCISPQVPSGEW